MDLRLSVKGLERGGRHGGYGKWSRDYIGNSKSNSGTLGLEVVVLLLKLLNFECTEVGALCMQKFLPS